MAMNTPRVRVVFVREDAIQRLVFFSGSTSSFAPGARFGSGEGAARRGLLLGIYSLTSTSRIWRDDSISGARQWTGF